MASIKHYPNGAGGTTGGDLAILPDFQYSGKFIYLGNAVTGASDANTGLERNKPLLTLAQAYANISAMDTVIVLENHNELIGTSVVWNKANTSIVGEGSGSTIPRFTCTGAIAMIDITASCVLLDNLKFPASTAVPTARVRAANFPVNLNHLSFDCGASDTNRSVSINSAGNAAFDLRNLTFTATAATPGPAIEVQLATTVLYMDNVTFDGGSFGWNVYAFLGTATVFGMRATSINLLNGSDMLLPASSNGYIQINDRTGDSRIDWTA